MKSPPTAGTKYDASHPRNHVGTEAGRKTLLAASQVLQVGRTEWADFSVPHDGRMSGVHFALETDNAACHLRDLGSTNGTQLNGIPVTERIALHTGDKIQAGETIFSVDIEGDVPRQVAAPFAAPVAAPHAEAFQPPVSAGDGATPAPCRSGARWSSRWKPARPD